MTKQKAIIVLGMHRSGTSAFAGVLSILDVNFGRELMKPAEDNPKGFFENARFYALNESLLKAVGSSWDSLFPLPRDWWRSAELDQYRDEIKSIILEEFGGDALFGIKDPRISKLFPLWIETLKEMSIDTSFVVPIRNPLEVAASLRQRNGFSIEKAALLWVEHILDLELSSRGLSRILVSFEDLMEDPTGTLENIAQELGLKFPRSVSSAKNAIGAFLEPANKHHNLDANDIDGKVLADVSRCYRLMLKLASRKGNLSAELEEIDVLRHEFSAIRDSFYNEDLVSEFKVLRAELDGKAAIIEEKNRITEERNRVAEERNRVAEERDRITEERNRITEERNRILEEKERQLCEKEHQICRANKLTLQKEEQLNSLLNSLSWRAMAPFRAIHASLSVLRTKRHILEDMPAPLTDEAGQNNDL